jgi:hypothetical protein
VSSFNPHAVQTIRGCRNPLVYCVSGFGYSAKGFHQFSPVFTSLWAAVEVNAVQTKYDIRGGAIAALKNKEHIP